ncbi:MAG: extensin family protein [Erythrobacter sp.]|nr:extensin family protein [Erythrobacter sp.]
MADNPRTISTRIGRFVGDRRVIAVLVLAALIVAGRAWLAEHPEHDPWAPLDLRDPPGWATTTKLQALRDDVPQCRAVLERSEVAFTALDPQGEGECARPDRTRLDAYPLSPSSPPTTCPVAIAMELWRTDSLEPAAQEIFGSDIARIEHLGAYSCRRLYGRDSGAWSEHVTGNAIDIAGFVLEDGTRISVLRDWEGDDDEARFLRRARDGACDAFATTLSPDYNAAHADHFHLDMSPRWSGVCR